MNYILLNIIINSILVGVILMTQFINYPLFKSIKSDFTNYHKKYTERMGYVVAPLMVIELILVTYIILHHKENLFVIFIFLLTIIIWASTFFIQVPIHNTLSKKKEKNKIIKLNTSNYIRTICWILKLIISIHF
ncbi:MAG: hypothetical protein CMP74_04440, partial [Flavobacteriales bacterium]|nr:hypothetical protein [Flavobacteriales bacterium]